MQIFAPGKQSGKRNAADLQRLINLFGYSKIKVDGAIGNNTLKAIWSLPKESSEIVDAFAKARNVVYPRRPSGSVGKTTASVDIAKQIRATASGLGVNPDLALIIARIESDLDPKAKSPTGAVGIFQLTSSAVKDVVQRHPVLRRPNREDWYELDWNILVGVKYIKIIVEEYLNETAMTKNLGIWADAYGAYNLGIGNLRKLRQEKYDDKSLNKTLNVQAGYLVKGGPSKYLATVRSKLESVLA